MRLSKEAAQHFLEVKQRYIQETGNTQAEVRDIVVWARERGELEISPEDVDDILVARMSAALQGHHRTLENGTTVRLHYCIVVTDGKKQRTLWAHIDDADRDFLRQSFVQRKKRVSDDIESIRNDLAFVNTRLVDRGEKKIQMVLRFPPRVPVH